MDLPVTDDGARLIGPEGKCCYCLEPLGSHKDTCVCLKKAVVMEIRIQYIRSYPRSWEPEMMEFHHNESSWCASNDMEALVELVESKYGCWCGPVEAVFVRDATPEDLEEEDLPNTIRMGG